MQATWAQWEELWDISDGQEEAEDESKANS